MSNDRITIAFLHHDGRLRVKTFTPPYHYETFLGYVSGLAYEVVGDIPDDVAQVLSIYDE